jgi:beta-glucosidase-like glycosyl hydrolase
VLRGELKFDGVIATDDLSMLEETGESEYQDFASNAKAALVAGVDLVVDAGASDSGAVGERLESARAAVRDAVASGKITTEQIQSAAVRVLALRLSLR